MHRTTAKGFSYVLFSILVWSGWMVISRFAVKGALTAYDITAIRFTIAGLLLLPIVLKRGINVGPWGWKSSLLLSLLIGAPYTNIAVAGMLYAPSSHASTLINGSLLILTTIVGITALKEPTSPLRIIGVIFSIGGIVCMLCANSVYGGPNQWIGHICFIVSGLMWGGYTLLVRKWRADPLHASAVVCVFAMLSYMPFYLTFAHSHITQEHWHEVAFQAFYQGVLTGALAFIAFNKGVALLGASRAATVTPLVPVLSTLIAIPVLGEIPSFLEWTGVATVSFGVLLASGVLHWRPGKSAIPSSEPTEQPITTGKRSVLRWFMLLLLISTPNVHAQAPQTEGMSMPLTNLHQAITSQNIWLNTSRKIEAQDLRGRIILLDFWTLGCINCMHVIPDLQYLEATFGNALTVIGVHSAKFANEGDTENIRSAILRYGLHHPVVNDFDFSIWKKFGVRAWPTFILINPAGTIESTYSGEGNRDRIAADITKLIAKYGNQINRQPLPIALESAKQPDTILRFPGKIIAFDNHFAIADSGHNRIVITALNGEIESVIGDGKEGLKDGDYTHAEFFGPQGMAYKDGLLYVADTKNHALRAIDITKQTVITIAGTGAQGTAHLAGDGIALSIPLSSPWDVSFYPDNTHLTIAMAGTHQLWSYDTVRKTLSLFAGSGQESIEDGRLPNNSLSQPSGLSVSDDTLYFADAETSALRKSDKNGTITTLIGTGLFDFGYKEGTRSTALMQHCLGLVADGSDIYIADTYNHSIRRYNSEAGILHNYAGHNTRGDTDGALAQASFNEPGGIAKLGNVLYVADTNNHRIRTIDMKTGIVSTLPVMPQKPAAAALSADSLPNLQTLAFSVAAGLPVDISLTLNPGWHINDKAPSMLALTHEKDPDFAPITYDLETLKTGTFTLPALLPGLPYHLQGTLYYCENKVSSLCMLKSFDVTLSASGTETKLALPVYP